MAQNSHNMAIFPHFLAFLVTFLVVRTTFMRLTSTERTQRPVTHTEWWCWTIWTISKHPSGVRVGGSKIWLFLSFGQAGYRSRNPSGNCFMSHIKSHYMAKHVSGPFVPSKRTLGSIIIAQLFLTGCFRCASSFQRNIENFRTLEGGCQRPCYGICLSLFVKRFWHPPS